MQRASMMTATLPLERPLYGLLVGIWCFPQVFGGWVLIPELTMARNFPDILGDIVQMPAPSLSSLSPTTIS